MPATFRDLPPDHPIFSGGPHFVFYEAPPQASDDPREADTTPEEDIEEEG